MADRGLTHGLKYQARAIAPVLADPRRVCWLVGTNAVREENEVRRPRRELSSVTRSPVLPGRACPADLCTRVQAAGSMHEFTTIRVPLSVRGPHVKPPHISGLGLAWVKRCMLSVKPGSAGFRPTSREGLAWPHPRRSRRCKCWSSTWSATSCALSRSSCMRTRSGVSHPAPRMPAPSSPSIMTVSGRVRVAKPPQ
jgi:hypothetical protein